VFIVPNHADKPNPHMDMHKKTNRPNNLPETHAKALEEYIATLFGLSHDKDIKSKLLYLGFNHNLNMIHVKLAPLSEPIPEVYNYAGIALPYICIFYNGHDQKATNYGI
jgi:hypothetical protein